MKKHVTGKEPIFDKAYLLYHNKSDILNRVNKDVFKPSLDKRNCLNLKKELADQIPELEEQLSGVKVQFKDHQQEKINCGWEKPTEMPEWIKEDFFTLEARINIKQNELEKIEKLLATFQKSVDNSHQKEVLRFGVRGSGSMRNGVIADIDGQTVSIIGGCPTIDDKFSPFDGMWVSDYRNHVVTAHLKTKAEKGRQAEQYRKECLKKHETIDEAKYRSLSDYNKIDKSWPKGVQNWKA